jgi:putative sigma-54 modulation protein
MVSDVNGPKGGVDKLCRILIKSAQLPDIVITEYQPNISTAIDRCIAPARQSLSQKLNRNKQSLKRRMKLRLIMIDDDSMARN